MKTPNSCNSTALNAVVWEKFVHVDQPLTPHPLVDQHGFFRNPLRCPHGFWMPPWPNFLCASSSNTLATSVDPSWQASWRGFLWSSSLAAGVALPSVNRVLAISGWLYVAAKCKGVDPCASVGSMIIPGLFNNVVKASWLPRVHFYYYLTKVHFMRKKFQHATFPFWRFAYIVYLIEWVAILPIQNK